MSQEKKLACHVIGRCVDDFQGGMSESDYQFLTGQTEIAQFWFSVADFVPLRGEKEELFNRLREMSGRGLVKEMTA